MATAFYGTLVIRGDSGKLQCDRFTNTDVTLAWCLFDSTGGNSFIDVTENGYITDMILNIVAAGTTLTFKLYISQIDSGIRWVQSASFPTINNRFFNMNPVRVLKGQRLQIQTVT
jgi:hypothetical protein